MLRPIAEGVLIHRSELLENNAVVVRGPGGDLVVDPGLTEAELSCLARDLRESGRTVAAGFATHPDWDHVLWHPDLGDAPRYGTARCAERMREVRADADWRSSVAEGLPPEIAEETPLDLFGLLTGLPEGAVRLPWDGPEVRIVEHPAHAPGHAALLVPERGVLIAGDMLSDVLVPNLDELGDDNDPVGEYLTGLELLEAAAAGVDVLVPGHGSVADAAGIRARIEADRAYVLALREGRVPADLRVGDTAAPGWEWTTDIGAEQVRRLAERSERS
ncbi:MBL fold metallo-hydrolase [Glycomyces endophyticus]|uniref:MBL fold metallo-hydrolase n=1 Tax=Glycomyces endophyticus TaxID=480996 RepID=A0ABN2FTN6_9ACTN